MEKNNAKISILWTFARIAVGMIFAYAGFSKLTEPVANFETSLLKYGVFSPLWIPWIARIVPWFEWFFGAFFVLGYAVRSTAIGTTLLSLGFLATLTSSNLFLQAGGTDCGCFGQFGIHLSLHQMFVVDLICFGASLRMILLKQFPFSLDSFLLKR